MPAADGAAAGQVVFAQTLTDDIRFLNLEVRLRV
jgi:hypothetical protein